MRALLTFASRSAFAALSALAVAAALGCSSTSRGGGLGDGGTNVGPVDSNGTSNSTTCYASSDYCNCSYAGTGAGNATACGAASVTAAVCCADIGWPDHNLSCSCNSFTCKLQNGTTGDSCQCSTYESGNLSTCTDTVCCASTDTGSCHCGPAITCMETYETQVDSCTASVATCVGSTQTRVSGCAQ